MSVDDQSASGLLYRILTSDEGRRDPYPLYDELRSAAPVLYDETLGFWCLTRFADCRSLLRSSSFGKPPREDRGALSAQSRRKRGEDDVLSMLFLDPPDHTRIRGLVSRAFTPRRIQAMRPEVERLTDELLDDLGEPGEVVNLIDGLAFQLPVRVIAALVGVPAGDADWFRPRTAAMVRTLEPGTTEAEVHAADAAYADVLAYMRELVENKRASPGDDLLSALVAVEAEGDRLSEGEMLANTILLFTAGFETTTNLIGNGVLALLRHPDQKAKLLADPLLYQTAVEEILRFDGPVQLDARTALEATDIDGHRIEAGQMVMTLLGAANRDPAAVERPNEFDVTRSEVPIMSLGSGIHYCLGASLARLEGHVVLERLFGRFPDLELAEPEPPRKPALTIRGLEQLPVRL